MMRRGGVSADNLEIEISCLEIGNGFAEIILFLIMFYKYERDPAGAGEIGNILFNN